VLAEIESVSATLKPWEKIAQVKLIFEPFSMANQQLTQTLKVKRPEVTKVYDDDIRKMYERRRKG
jgi:long-subunit acyl-CoA synthetase (AMP-forming)